MTRFRIEKLARSHSIDDFDCRQESLNQFLLRYAMLNQLASASQTYVGLAGETVIGFYTLAVGEVAHDDASARLKKGLARHPVPVMVLARLAVDRRWQGQRVGAGLLKDAARRTTQVAEIAGIRALLVHAKDDAARAFYEHFGFSPSPTNPLHLSMLLKELRHIAENA